MASSSGSSAAKRLKKLAAEIPDDSLIRTTLLALDYVDTSFADHAIAMIGASVIDKALEVAIVSQLWPMTSDDRSRLFSFDANGPLSDLSARIKIGSALGIFGPRTRSDLEIVRIVRNAFAHAIKVLSFNTAEIVELCNGLHAPTRHTLLTQIAPNTPRGRFIDTAISVAESLKNALNSPPENHLERYVKIKARDRILP